MNSRARLASWATNSNDQLGARADSQPASRPAGQPDGRTNDKRAPIVGTTCSSLRSSPRARFSFSFALFGPELAAPFCPRLFVRFRCASRSRFLCSLRFLFASSPRPASQQILASSSRPQHAHQLDWRAALASRARDKICAPPRGKVARALDRANCGPAHLSRAGAIQIESASWPRFSSKRARRRARKLFNQQQQQQAADKAASHLPSRQAACSLAAPRCARRAISLAQMEMKAIRPVGARARRYEMGLED